MIGKVYKIIERQSNKIYIGSTINNLSSRWIEHKSNIKSKNKGIYIYFENVKDLKIILIKEYEIVDKEHLKVYEQLWMNKLKPCNERLAYDPLKKQTIKNSVKQTRLKNIEKIKEKKRIKYKCIICDKELNYGHKSRHEKTKKHQSFLL